jgi:hypothetical protein
MASSSLRHHQPTDIENLKAPLAEGLTRSQIGERLGMTRCQCPLL